MPRQVDHDARREELARAVWALIREQGVAGVTIRNLSEHSGWSSGAIRHYLPNREAILNFAAQQLNAEAEKRLDELPQQSDDTQAFRAFLHALMPLDQETRLWMEVWLAYASLATTDPGAAHAQGMLYDNLRAALIQILTHFQQVGQLPAHTPEQAATEIHALIDGLSLHLLMHRLSPAQATQAVDAALSHYLSAN